MRSRPSAALGTALAAAAVGGCGGDERLSRDELISRGDALCREARDRSPRPPTQRTLPRLADYTEELVAVSTDIVDRFRELEPPEAEEEKYDDLVSAAEQRLAEFREAQGAARNGDAQGFAAALERERKEHAPRYRRLAKEIGFKVCGSGG